MPQNSTPRHSSVAGPIILISIGLLFLVDIVFFSANSVKIIGPKRLSVCRAGGADLSAHGDAAPPRQ